MKTFILLIEYDKKIYSEKDLDNYIVNLKRRNYNFIYYVITPNKVNLDYPDRIYISDSKFCFLNVIKSFNLYYDYLIHLRCLNCINFDKLINFEYLDNNIYTSNSKNANVCKIIPKNLVSKLNITYYSDTNIQIINCFYKTDDVQVNNISNNESNEMYIQNYEEASELISIIMTCYNSEKTIDYAIISILNQTYNKINLIIIDDGSTDNTCNIIKKYKDIDDRIIFFKLNENHGCYYAKNIGLKNMNKKTRYIAFQDSDDISISSRISKQYYFMKKYKLFMSTCLFCEDKLIKMPMISKMLSINVFNSLGFFGPKRYGEDEHFYNRFFCLFTKNHVWNNSIVYNSNNIGYFSKYKYYKNLEDILYIVFRNKNSLTNTIKNRKEFSQKMLTYYSHLNNQSLKKIKDKCFYSLNYVNSKIDEYNKIKDKVNINNPIIIENQTNENEYFFDNSIDQVYISESLLHLKKRFFDKYQLKHLTSFYKPCLFFGLYTEKDIKIFSRMRSKKYVIWGGTDLDLSHKIRLINFKRIMKYGIDLNYAISDDLEKRMKFYKMKYEKIKFSLLDENTFYPTSLRGNNIFIYNGFDKGNEDIYGKNVYEKIVELLPEYKFIFSNQLKIPNHKMCEIYKKCFIGLRLTSKDGNANMVEEMIKMNIPVIHNGDYKKAIKWKNISSIISAINKSLPKILIIFQKDMNLHDGSFVWLNNFISLVQHFYEHINITVYCKELNHNIHIKNVNFIDKIYNFKYDHIFFRIMDVKINFENYNNVTLIIHKFELDNISYYKNFKYVIAQSILIKDELKFNEINNITILPPLIHDINITTNKSNILTFCYCGTIKKQYQTLELLELFENLSNDFDFKFNLIYGKIKKNHDDYDIKLLNLIRKLKKSKHFNIYYDINKTEINNILKLSHYGIVIHSKETDFKQQSTKLIEYLSNGCIPITYLTFLNSGYIDKNLNFRTIKELSEIIIDILNYRIVYEDININLNKLSSHLIKSNSHIFNQKYKTFITNKKVEGIDRILITSNYENIFLNEKVIFSQNNLNEIRNIIENDQYTNKKIKINTNFLLNQTKYFDINYINYLFKYDLHKNYMLLNDIVLKNDIYYFNNNESYIEFNCYLLKKYNYEIILNSEIENDGNLFLLSITDINGVLKDINRNVHFVKSSNNSIKFIINPKKNASYIFKLIPSKRNKDSIIVKILDFQIRKEVILNKVCDKIKVINMDKHIDNFNNIYNTFERNGIICERELGIDGQLSNLKDQYETYKNEPYNEKEKILGRKLIVSSGAIGYLHSMANIFKEAIINNYEYIMVCDDDIRIIDHFTDKFNKLHNSLWGKYRLLMLGSSQWDWDNIKYDNKYYYHPNDLSNGSFSNIYHRSTFEQIYNKVLNFSHPFDDEPMKSNFINNYCYVSYPNLIIAQLEDSSIRKNNSNRSYERFRWVKDNYNYYRLKEKTLIKYKYTSNKHFDLHFVIGIVTYNRYNYLKKCMDSLINTLQNNIDYTILIADGNSDDNTIEYINNLNLPKNISLTILINDKHFIYRQSNSILKFASNLNYNFGFLINDDIIFKKYGWDVTYYNASIKSNFHHLVYFDPKFKKKDHYNYNKYLQSYCKPENCQGALFTFTKNLIEKIGYFDEDNFKIRGHSHIDFTLRCCRLNFNDNDYLYDILNSHEYLELNNKDYISSFTKLPFQLRELYKVDIYEQDKRIKILKDKSRKLIDSNLQFIEC